MATYEIICISMYQQHLENEIKQGNVKIQY